jgi:hypothetical protein
MIHTSFQHSSSGEFIHEKLRWIIENNMLQEFAYILQKILESMETTGKSK